MNGEKSLRVCGEESPGDEYTFSLVSDLCPQGPCSGLDSEGRTPYRRTSIHSSPVASCARQSGAEGQSRGSGWDRAVTLPPRTIIGLQSTERAERGAAARGSSSACRAQSGCPGRPSPCLACTAPAWMAAPLQPAWEDSSRTSACARSSSVNHKVCSELLEWASSESYIGHTLSWTSKQGWAKAPARSPCGHHA